MYYYIAGSYFDAKRYKQVSFFWGAFQNDMEAKQYAYNALANKQAAKYDIVTSEHRDRDEAKREWVSGSIISGGDIDMVQTRFGRKMQ